MDGGFNSADYWDARYSRGGTSGAGSQGRLVAHKAAVINSIVALNGIAHVADFGCGDGTLLGMLEVPAYTGLDASPHALRHCATRFPQHRFLPLCEARQAGPADLCLSVDVIFHLVEDGVFADHLAALFGAASGLVLIYASNTDPHVRHRRFTSTIAATFPDWRLCAHLPNPYPYDPAQPQATSFADFFVYARPGRTWRLAVP
jgi:SAM-dependent methyltransferase